MTAKETVAERITSYSRHDRSVEELVGWAEGAMIEGANDKWEQPARIVRAESNAGLIEKYRGIVSLPFEPRRHKRITVMIVDDPGIESVKLLDLPS